MAFRQHQHQPSADIESSSTHAEKYENTSEHTPLSPHFPQHSNSQLHINTVPPVPPVPSVSPYPSYPPQPTAVSSPTSFQKLNDSEGSPKGHGNGRSSSWDLLGGLSKSIDEFDPRNARYVLCNGCPEHRSYFLYSATPTTNLLKVTYQKAKCVHLQLSLDPTNVYPNRLRRSTPSC